MPIAPSTIRWLGATPPSRPRARAGMIDGNAAGVAAAIDRLRNSRRVRPAAEGYHRFA